jgi:hypothetical protein
MAEDSFEKARRVFFGTVATVPKVSASPTECLKPEDSPTAEESLHDPSLETPALDLR